MKIQVVALTLWVTCGSCTCNPPVGTVEDIDSSWNTRGVVTIPVESKPVADAGIRWGTPTYLKDVEGLWGSKDGDEGWVFFSSKDTSEINGKSWKYPYPWRFMFHHPHVEGTFDCGVYDQLITDGAFSWRVAWCGGTLSSARRYARRLSVRHREEEVSFILVELEGVPPLELDQF